MDAARFHEKVGDLLSKTKTFAGRPSWETERGGAVYRVRVQLIIDGTVRIDVALTANALTHISPQPMTLQLIVDDRPIERIESLAAPHSNRFDKRVPARLRGMHLPLGSNQLHPWEANHAWPASDNLPVAELASFDTDPASVIRFGLERWRIDSDLPPPPHEPRLDL